jgi:hypothetical protein
MNGIIQIKNSTIPRSNPRYTRYHHKAYILSLKQQNKKKQNDGCKRISNPQFQQYLSYIMATSFSGGGSRSTRKNLPTLDKQLVNFITCDYESSAPDHAPIPLQGTPLLDLFAYKIVCKNIPIQG